MSKDEIHIITHQFYNGYLAVPSYEVRRCKLLRADMILIYKNKGGEEKGKIRIPLARLDEYERTGIQRKLKHGGEYEMLNYRWKSFSNPTDKIHEH